MYHVGADQVVEFRLEHLVRHLTADVAIHNFGTVRLGTLNAQGDVGVGEATFLEFNHVNYVGRFTTKEEATSQAGKHCAQLLLEDTVYDVWPVASRLSGE
jgi:hypothetical protein